ncbi:Cyclin protein [Dictyocaulus viviparus]|uniref:Cyclin protein n=1 Tax=Dictyocaulus viviparus TaxID=29172 RepID=A0A0D8XPB2_DICVI|nr:Cyclin protein [Dictyocaulus viviparus]
MANLIPCWKSQRTVFTRLPPLMLSSPLDIFCDQTMPKDLLCLPKSTDSIRLPENTLVNTSNESYYDVQGDEIYDNSVNHSLPCVLPNRTKDNLSISLPYRPYCQSGDCVFEYKNSQSLFDATSMSDTTPHLKQHPVRNIERPIQSFPKVVALNMDSDAVIVSSSLSVSDLPFHHMKKLHSGREIVDDLQCCTNSSSNGYATGSSNRSWTNKDDAFESNPIIIPSDTQNCNFMKNSSTNSPNSLPPAAYADASPGEPYQHYDQDLCASQNSSGSVSDFFSQSGSSSSDFSDASPPHRDKSFITGDNHVTNDMTLVKDTHHSFIDLTPLTRNRICSPSAFSKRSVPTVSSTCSPIAKRGRFVNDHESRIVVQTAARKQLLNFQRYCNEYARDTYAWLAHQEASIHAIGPLFMSAQKPTGASHEDRRSVLLRATSEMRKRKHTLEAIHLGAYILDKCLDSFHISKDALPDVCAVSMVLGTKMEEYDSLQPGTVKGLVGATMNKSRLCDIEKRIVFELVDGLCFPTPLVFANYMLVELSCNEEEIRFAHYLLDLALLNSRFRDEGGPRVAHAAVCISSTIVRKRESPFDSECDALIHVERSLLNFTKFPIGSTRDVMRRLMYEMAWALQEKHSILIDYLSEDNRRVCFCEGSPALWELICGVHASSCGRAHIIHSLKEDDVYQVSFVNLYEFCYRFREGMTGSVELRRLQKMLNSSVPTPMMPLLNENVDAAFISLDQREKAARERLVNEITDATRYDNHINREIGDNTKQELYNLQQNKDQMKDENTMMKNLMKKHKKREKVNVRRTVRKPEPSKSLTDTDESLPLLNQIRFEDNIVAITDPEIPSKPETKSKNKRNGDKSNSPNETLLTAETFTSNSERNIVLSREDRIKLLQEKKNELEKKEEQAKSVNSNEKCYKKSDVNSNEKATKKEDLHEPRLLIGNRMYSLADVENSLKKLTQYKNMSSESAGGNRRHLNMSRIGSTVASKASSPQKKNSRTLVGPTSHSPPRKSSRIPLQANFQRVPLPPSQTTSQRQMLTMPSKEMTTSKRAPLNFHGIDSCRTSKAASPVGENKGEPKKRILVGNHFMSVDQAEDLFHRLLKENKGKRSLTRISNEKMEEDKFLTPRLNLSTEVHQYCIWTRSCSEDIVDIGERETLNEDPLEFVRKNDNRRRRLSAETTDEADCNFSHLNSVMRTEEEVTATLLGIIVGAIFFIFLCMSIRRSIM